MYSYKTDDRLIVNKHEYNISNKNKITLQNKIDRTNDQRKVLKSRDLEHFGGKVYGEVERKVQS